MANSIQTNARKVSENFKSAKIFRGVTRADGNYLKDFDQFITGYGHFVWLKMPAFAQAMYPEQTEMFKNITMAGFKSFNGIDDVQLDMLDVEGGVAGNKVRVAGNAKDTFEEFNIKVYEYLGSPIREYLDLWINGVRDFRTGYAHYQGALDNAGSGVTEYSNTNHTGTALYMLTDPTGRRSGLEYACLLSNIVPTKIPKNHLNYDSGDHNVVEVELQFSAAKDEGPEVNIIAGKVLDQLQKHNVLNYYQQKFLAPGGKEYDTLFSDPLHTNKGRNGEDYSSMVNN